MSVEFKLEEYLSRGIEGIVKSAIRATVKNPKEGIFLGRYALASHQAAKVRAAHERQGEHIPPFLIASITSACNLHCKGCYARANHSCGEACAEESISADRWRELFSEARSLGISFILLAGGEPLLRPDVIQVAAEFPQILFPVFTNGTVMDAGLVRLFDQNRNLIPVLSIEGDQAQTDERRGDGVYAALMRAMEQLDRAGALFGSSITVTAENLDQVTSGDFVDLLQQKGVKICFYVEYVPTTPACEAKALDDEGRVRLDHRLAELRADREGMLFLSFPGDEKDTGGCLAAGRGFFHINYHGGVEPCPFSAFSDTSVKNGTLLQALNSPLFRKLADSGMLLEDHVGGCVLAKQEQAVRRLLEMP